MKTQNTIHSSISFFRSHLSLDTMLVAISFFNRPIFVFHLRENKVSNTLSNSNFFWDFYFYFFLEGVLVFIWATRAFLGYLHKNEVNFSSLHSFELRVVWFGIDSLNKNCDVQRNENQILKKWYSTNINFRAKYSSHLCCILFLFRWWKTSNEVIVFFV